MAITTPAGRSFEFLLNQMRSYQGSLAGGTAEFYNAGSTSLTAVYLDVNLSQQAANPYVLSADGIAELFGNNYYRIVIKNAQGVIVFDFDWVECLPVQPVGSTPPPSGGTGSVHRIYNLLGAPDQTQELTTDYNQYITRIGDSGYVLKLVPPAGYTFYSQQGNPIQQFTLYGDGETVQFLLSGTFYYTVIG